jgi:alanine dehydrogenase
MLVGVPKEIKENEYRVGIVPSTVHELTENGHQVVIEKQAGTGAGFGDADYKTAGAEIVSDGDAVFARAELIVKVKEPLATERSIIAMRVPGRDLEGRLGRCDQFSFDAQRKISVAGP